MTSPSSTSPPPPPPTTTHLRLSTHPPPCNQPPPTTTTISPPKKPQPLPWTNQETINLIQSYQQKWYSLKRGQLKASQWEEVAISVASRCGFNEPTKTATQCRHKMEKLRKRYRAERVKPYPNSWQYFQLMDNMERGPFPLSAVAQPLKMVPEGRIRVSSLGEFDRDNGDDSDDNEFGNGVDDIRKIKSKSINNILRGGMGAVYGRNDCNENGSNGGGGGIYIGNGRRIPVFGGNERGMMNKAIRESSMMNSGKRKLGYEDSDDGEDDDEDQDVDVDGDGDDEKGASDGGKELAAEIRGFAERFMRVEKMKIEMMRETERYRMEMERRRMEMIVDSQRKIVDSIGRAFRAHKKLNTGQEL
ncbi:hypothetical protein Leryth_018729 [Lithospermum erythrorhizon]|nr:hypothetical protein Leryth_018729 [Lithospermum erythrorhizon]